MVYQDNSDHHSGHQMPPLLVSHMWYLSEPVLSYVLAEDPTLTYPYNYLFAWLSHILGGKITKAGIVSYLSLNQPLALDTCLAHNRYSINIC